MRRIILDTDLSMGEPGSEIDDGFALALAAADPELRLELITSVNGNTDVETATLLSLELAERLGLSDVPVVRGAAAPLTRPDRARGAPEEIRERYGRHVPTPGYAAAAIADLVMRSPGEITIVAIGPLTNVAAAIVLEPALAENVQEIVVMGGIFLGQTLQASMPGEFNVWVDPEAADTVLHSGAPLRWVGLDVTNRVRLTREHADRLAQGTGGFGPFAAEATVRWIERMRKEHPGDPSLSDSCAMHDPLAVAVVAHPELVTWRDAHVSVVTGEGKARGVMVTDLLTSAEPPAPNCRIATDVDVDAFMASFLGALQAL
ncbi:nucleoside hydrolase [Naasia sp. SYSU D00948]|uniref:nucleoside hydrolase n=1 Tax=Naasia sp. SYSU D00948 TaxID=2817379 RepID=UPI001B303C2A|nr:nucleoside hydrolase [Naasia sp. SYSU D00948]